MIGACSSSSSSETGTQSSSTTTSVPTGPQYTTNPDATPKQAAVDEARGILAALHNTNEQYCATPSFESNITLPPEQKLPVPVTRATCVYDNAEVEVIAFADPADRAIYQKNWTERICRLSNTDGKQLLTGTTWVVNERSITLVPNADIGDVVAAASGGEVVREACPPSG